MEAEACKDDDRVPVIFGHADDADATDAVMCDGTTMANRAGVVEQVAAQPPHRANCVCCAGRAPIAVALSALFVRRARGEIGFFTRVIVDVRDPDLARAQLANDVMARARFRLPASPAVEAGASLRCGAI